MKMRRRRRWCRRRREAFEVRKSGSQLAPAAWMGLMAFPRQRPSSRGDVKR